MIPDRVCFFLQPHYNMDKPSDVLGQKTPLKQAQARLQQKPNTQEKQSMSVSSEQEVDFDPDSPNQKFFNLSDVKPLDLKAQWLGNTNQLINRYESKLEELKKEKIIMQKGFQRFAENQSRFRISSLRKINFQFDKKALYLQYMKKSRKTIERMHPSILINILSYVQTNVFLGLAKMRRVSQIFNFMYKNQQIIALFSQRDFGVASYQLQFLQKWCQKYVKFCQTLIYYKQIKYTEMIPQNSIKEDLQQSIDFVNQVYKRVYRTNNIEIGYFQLINKFMKQHRVVLALESLSFGELAVTRKASIIAFSNFLAFNPASRMKEEITKTKYLKMIQLVQDEFYRDSLVVNSKISNFLQEEYNYQISVFIDTMQTSIAFEPTEQPLLDIVIFHYHNPLKSFFAKGLTLKEGKFEVNQISLEFKPSIPFCGIDYMIGELNQSQYVKYHFMPTVGEKGKFGRCLVFHQKFYYVLLIKSDIPQEQQFKGI